jgi:membrane-bound lytic murein transglycosylase B
MNFLKKSVLSLILGLLAGCATEAPSGTGFGERAEVQNFIQEVSARDDFDSRYLTTLFDQVQPRPVFVKSTKKSAEVTMTWPRYRAIFMTQGRVDKGVAFWHSHEAAFAKAQQEYGVEPPVILGILGVETDYGKYLGKYRVMDALSALAFNYRRRSAFFQEELEQYLLLTRDLHKDPLSLYGSYAGAVGLPQFMPDSYRKLAVSEEGKAPDLWYNADDAILSIANYFHHKGWVYNQITAVRVDYPTALTSRFGDEYWLLYPNFNVIKRYNDSNFYAMTVYQLGEAIRREKYLR